LDLREHDLFAVRWSRDILVETRRSLVDYRGLPADRVDKRLEDMQRAFPDAEVKGYEGLISSLELPDANDRHVLAAAITGGAKQIVTDNSKDFPSSALDPFGIEAVTADTFLMNAFDLNPELAVATTKQGGKTWKGDGSLLGFEGVLRGLRKSGAEQFADAVARAAM
jgi:hypothetical protein